METWLFILFSTYAYRSPNILHIGLVCDDHAMWVAGSIHNLSRQTTYRFCVFSLFIESKNGSFPLNHFAEYQKQLSTYNYHHKGVTFKDVQSNIICCLRLTDEKTIGERKGKGRTGSGMRGRRKRKRPCGWQ